MENKLTVYISGKISGEEPKECRRKFERAEEFLQEKYQVINPYNYIKGKESWADAMMRDFELIRDKADVVFMLNDWTQSDGARAEFYFARGCGKRILFEVMYKE